MPEIPFILNDPGEGLVEAEITSWKVSEGDVINVNQIVVEIETAKSLVEVPSPFSGVVKKILVANGEVVNIGSAIMLIDTEHPNQTTEPQKEQPPICIDTTSSEERPAVLVGYGFLDDLSSSHAQSTQERSSPDNRSTTDQQQDDFRNSHTDTVSSSPHSNDPADTEEHPANIPDHLYEPLNAPLPRTTHNFGRPAAKPPVRKLAKELGVDLNTTEGTGPNGIITRQDVLNNASYAAADTVGGAASGMAIDSSCNPLEFVGDNDINGDNNPARIATSVDDAIDQIETADVTYCAVASERINVRGLRRQTAQNVARSAFNAPHVSVFVEVDVTRTMELVARLKKDSRYKQTRVSPLLILSKAVVSSIKDTPFVNSTWVENTDTDKATNFATSLEQTTRSELADSHLQQIVVHKTVNLGIAVATDRGLVVPNIKNAQNLSLTALAQAIADLVETARAGRIRPESTTGGTITITNIGVFGVDAGTPILNLGESAVIFLGAIKPRPWVVNGEIAIRQVTTLGGSFDHRVLDGDQASRFLMNIASILEEPALLLE